MSAVRVLLCRFCIGFIGWVGVFGSGGVAEIVSSRKALRNAAKILNIARGELGVKEVTGHNDGKRVRQYLVYTGINVPAPWCSAYVSWCFGQAGFKEPRTAWSPSLFPTSRLTAVIEPAVVYGIWFPALQRIGHCGMIESVRGDWITGLEGNTSLAGGREGEGVYRRIRHRRTISRYADWITLKNN